METEQKTMGRHQKCTGALQRLIERAKLVTGSQGAGKAPGKKAQRELKGRSPFANSPSALQNWGSLVGSERGENNFRNNISLIDSSAGTKLANWPKIDPPHSRLAPRVWSSFTPARPLFSACLAARRKSSCYSCLKV